MSKGIDIEQYKRIMGGACQQLDVYAQDLEQNAKDTKKAKTGGKVAAAGLLLAPFTGGASLALTVGGGAYGAAKAAGRDAIGSGDQLRAKVERAFQESFRLQGFLNKHSEEMPVPAGRIANFQSRAMSAIGKVSGDLKNKHKSELAGDLRNIATALRKLSKDLVEWYGSLQRQPYCGGPHGHGFGPRGPHGNHGGACGGPPGYHW